MTRTLYLDQDNLENVAIHLLVQPQNTWGAPHSYLDPTRSTSSLGLVLFTTSELLNSPILPKSAQAHRAFHALDRPSTFWSDIWKL